MSERRKVIQQGLAALGVVFSLVFVGYEIRQNTAAQRAQTRQALADGSRELVLTIGADPHLTRIYGGVFRLPSDTISRGVLTRLDTLQANTVMFANMRNVENVFLQVQEGVIDRSVLDTYAFTSPRFRSATFAEWWQGRRQQFDTAFVRAFEESNGILRSDQRGQ